jgi:uncharacterized membrane protein YbhN (UPF0104 family)
MMGIAVFIKKHGQSIVKVIIGFMVVYYLLVKLDFSSIYNSALRANMLFILIALMLLPVNIYFQFLKWQLSCNYFLNFYDKKRIWTSLFTGFSAAMLTPARIGEYMGRGIDLKEQNKVHVTAAVFYDKMYTLGLVIIVGLISSTLIYNNITFAFTALLLAVVILSAIIIIFYQKTNIRYFRKYKYFRKVLNFVKSVRFPDKSFSLKMFLFSSLFYLCYIYQFMLLLGAFSGSFNIVKFFLLAGIIMFTKTIIPNFLTGELGIRESASVFFLSLTGEDPSAGFNASIFLFLINIVIPSAAGIIPILKNKL